MWRKATPAARSAAAALLLLCAAPAVRAAEPICEQLKAFETPSPEQTQRRWVEFYWYGTWQIDAGFACLHSGDGASSQFCTWLSDNTSLESSAQLPLRILACKGVKPPRADARATWRDKITLPGKAAPMSLLEIDLEEARAIRLSLFAPGEDPSEPLPPLKAYDAAPLN